MPLYEISAPNGKKYRIEGPPGASDADVARAVLAQFPEAGNPPSTERTWGEAAKDIGAAFVSGLGGVAQFPGQVVGLLPGARGLGEALAAPGEALKTYGEGLKSQGLKVREALRSKALSDAEKEGMLAEFATAIKETVKDPALLSTFLTEQVPMLIGPGAAAKLTTMLGTGAVKAATTERAAKEAAEALGRRATAAAVGTGAVMQGADIGEETYKEAFKIAKTQGMSDEDAQKVALAKARVAAIEAGALSVGAQRLPGGRAIERRLAGVPGEGRLRGALGEALSEAIEEGGGAFAKNIGLQELEPTRSLTAGIGTAAGLGALGGAGLGAIVGGQPVERAAARGVAEAPIERAERLAAEKPAPPAAETPALPAPPAEETPAEPPAPPVAETPAPPVAETPAPPAEPPEPKVRKKGEPPATGMQPADIEALGIAKRQPIYRRLLGKDMNDPAQRDAVLADVEKYLIAGNGSEESRVKLAEFKQRFAPAEPETPAAEAAPPQQETSAAEAAPPQPETLAAEAAPPQPETPRVEPTEPEASGAGAPVVSEPGAGTAPGGVGVVEPSGVVPVGEDVAKPVAGKGTEPVAVTPGPVEAAKPAEPAKPTPAEIVRGEYEPPVKAGLKPERERQLREKLAQQRKELAVLEAARDKAEGNIYLAEITGNEEAKARAIDAHEGARQVLKKAVTAADRTYAQLFDLEKADFEGSVGEAYVAELIAEREAKAKAAREKAPDTTKWPYTLTTAEAVREDVEFELPHSTPEYKAYIEKFFTPSRKLRKGVSEEDAVREGQELLSKNTLYQRSRFAPVDLAESKAMDDALRGKSFTEAIDFAINNARDDFERVILIKAKRRANELAGKGVQFSFDLTAPGRILSNRALGLTTTVPAGLGDATAVSVRLNGFTGDATDSLSQETLAHETVHAVTAAQIEYAPQGSAAIKLRALQQELVGIYNQRFKAGTLTPTEKGVIKYALENDKELLAYGLTNGEVQNWLASIPSPSGGTFLSRMFDIVSQVLGLKGKENSALAQLMTISEEILDESLTPYVAEANRQGMSFGKQANVTGIPSWVLKEAQGLKPVWNKGPVALYEGTSTTGKTIYVAAKQNVGRTKVDIRSYTGPGFTPAELAELRQAADGFTPQISPRITPASEAAAAAADAIGEKEETSLTQKIGQQLAGNKALRLREKFADSLAPVEDFFVNAYGGQVRTASGRLNPMVLLSRALDALRVSKAVQLEGGLGREDGLIVATELKDAEGRSVSYSGVLKRIADAAKENKKTYEEYRKTIDNVLYGHREYNLREKNKTLSADEQIELQLGDAEIDALEKAFQQDDFIKQISADLDTIRFNLIDMLVETGRVSAEQAQDYKDATGYIPFQRIGDYENKWSAATRGANRGVAALKQIRKLEGSKRQSASVIENFSGLVDWATKEAMKNEAASRALEDMVLMGAAKRGPKPATDSPGGVAEIYENGVKRQFYVPDPAHLVAFSLADPQLSSILKAAQRGAQVLRAGVTAMPPFAIKQVFDDVVRAYTYAGVKNNAELVRNVLTNFPKNWFNEVFRRKDEGIRKMERLGIVGTFDFTQQTNLKNVLEEAGAKQEGLGSTIMRVMEAGAKASDLAVRQAIYDQVMKETGDTAQAESAAREIINFSRRGSSKLMGQMISIIPFFNAYARGMDKLATAAAGKYVGKTTGTARAMFYHRMAVLTAMGFAYALMMQDDDEYNKLPDHVRDTNWILPYGKDLGFVPAIPIPAELAFFFKVIPERIVRYYKYQGTPEERTTMDVLGELTKRGIDVFSSPNITPQVLRPFVENMANYSWFLGRPLESQAQLALRPFERYGTGTSDTMKLIARGLEDVANATGTDIFAVSPIKLENAVRGLMGTGAGMMLSFFDAIVNPSRTDRPLHQQLTPQLTGASALMKNAVGTRYMDEIYDLEKRVEQVNGTYNRLLKSDPEGADKFIRDNIGIYAIREPVKGIMGAIRTLNEAAMTIDRDTSLSPEERRKRIDELRAEQNEIARVVFAMRKQARDIQAGR